jgi:predicted ATPase
VSDSPLRQITLRNFKRFERFTLACTNANVLVGPNNAGKSTILDAFRILYGAKRYASRLRPTLVRAGNQEVWGYKMPDTSIPVNIANIASNYADDDAELIFTHTNGARLHILLTLKFGFSISVLTLVNELRFEELDPNLVIVLRSLEKFCAASA